MPRSRSRSASMSPMIASELVIFALTPFLLSAGWQTHLSPDAELEPLKRLTELLFVSLRCRQSRKHGQNMDKTFASGARELGLSKPLVVDNSGLRAACYHAPTSCATLLRTPWRFKSSHPHPRPDQAFPAQAVPVSPRSVRKPPRSGRRPLACSRRRFHL